MSLDGQGRKAVVIFADKSNNKRRDNKWLETIFQLYPVYLIKSQTKYL